MQEDDLPSCGRDDGDVVLPKVAITEGKECTKCHKAVAVAVWKQRTLCWPCMKFALEGKVRRYFSSVSLRPPAQRVLVVATSGGAASRVILHLACRASVMGTKQRFRVRLVHVDECCLWYPEPDEVCRQRAARRDHMRALGASYGVPVHVVPLEHALPDSGPTADAGAEAQEGRCAERSQAVRRLFQSLPDATSREDLLAHLRLQLLSEAAAAAVVAAQGDTATEGGNVADEPVLVVGDCADRLAQRLIASTCKGRGSVATQEVRANEVRPVDGRNVTLLRPLHDILLRSVATFVHQEGWNTLFTPAWATMARTKRFSINHLAETFIAGLQDHFGQTVPTLIRTANKLQTRANLLDSCESILEQEARPGDQPHALTTCYSCQRIGLTIEESEHTHAFELQAVRNRAYQRQVLSDFLLSESDDEVQS